METDSSNASRLLAIPPEIREQIYTFLLAPSANRRLHPNNYTSYDYGPSVTSLFHINKQIYLEALPIFRRLNVIVRIETPWPQAVDHVAHEGHVPMLATGEVASRFEGWTLGVGIDAPEVVGMDMGVDQRFLILAEDLEKFTQMWFYSNLSHPGLNPQLRLTLTLRGADTDEALEDGETRREALDDRLQQRLVMPFGRVKNLHSVCFNSSPRISDTLPQRLSIAQKDPDASPEYCLREATRLKLLGNTALAQNDFHGALELYKQAWKAMHVIIAGRVRHIHADAFFGRELREPPFEGKNGQSERLILRIQLVANTCAVYLKLKDYEECVFWGMRSISMLRDAMGGQLVRGEMSAEDEAVLGFPAADQMGKIYFRTGVAQKELGDKAEARRLLRVAQVYLPRDELVRKELGECVLKIG